MNKFATIAALIMIAGAPALAQTNQGANPGANAAMDAKPSGAMAQDAKPGSMSMSMGDSKPSHGAMMMKAKPKKKNSGAMSNSMANAPSGAMANDANPANH